MNYRFEVLPKTTEPNILKTDDYNYITGKTYYIKTESELNTKDFNFIKYELLSDSVIEDCFTQAEKPEIPRQTTAIVESLFKAGVTDNAARTLNHALKIFLPKIKTEVYTGKTYHFKGDFSKKELLEYADKKLSNPLLNTNIALNLKEYQEHSKTYFHAPRVQLKSKPVELIDINQELEELELISKSRTWALNKEELKTIKSHFNSNDFKEVRIKKGISELPTDVEMEIIAQSWSEHCKHKIFAAKIKYSERSSLYKKLEEQNVNSIFKTFIAKPTEKLMNSSKSKFLVSIFKDNAGIIRFDKHLDVCAKVETHNSPSALDPYGGALTGILGVNRDIIGTGIGAKPIANMDVFCLSHENIETRTKLPSNLLKPKDILRGVHKGVEDGGNKSGIPTVNGSFLFDDNYAGKPLIYVGSVGVLPPKTDHYNDTSEKNQKAGDYAVVAGGRVGADGIHGATFSSLALDENSPTTAVQIGDPFTQKKLLDFTLAARDMGLYSSITDNGAGGISSSLGEMAEKTGGIKIDLSKLKLKYQGLSSYEKMISESQERMSYSVPPENFKTFENLAIEMDVEVCNLGEFTNSGYLEVYEKNELVSYLNMNFLHEGLPQMELTAEFDPKNNQWKAWHNKESKLNIPKDKIEILKILLSSENISSKEKYIRAYDHEVGAATCVKAFNGKTYFGPTDAGVLDLEIYGGEKNNALAISNGNQSLLSKIDPYYMAHASCDEAIRNLISTGAEFEQMALLDNFCWPDPIESETTPDGKHKLAGLLRAGFAIKEVIEDYEIPFISGKDSMKNDFEGLDHESNKVKISVPPSLLITGVAKIKKSQIIESCFQKPGDLVYLIGPREQSHFLYGELGRQFNLDKPEKLGKIDTKSSKNIFVTLNKLQQTATIKSCHDLSEGGALVALTESCFGNRLGVKLNNSSDELYLWYNENLSNFIISIDPKDKELLESNFENKNILQLGKCLADYYLEFQDTKVDLNDLESSWRSNE